MNTKKISIIGKGTAGCITALFFSQKFPNIQIDWYFDPQTPEKAVGEGSTLAFPDFLNNNLNLFQTDIENLFEGTYKNGIRKINYEGVGDFIHSFPLGVGGLHFNANKFQKFVLNFLKSKVNLIPQVISNLSQINSTYIIDCSGTPKNPDSFKLVNSIPVNSAHIVQCKWEKPEFNYTLTIARPYGWVFGIPLQNRCSIGYLYNKNINSLKEVKEDIKEIFKQFNLTPNSNSNSFSFNNYYKKENFTEKVAYNGNASFFLEPLEATSISTIIFNCHLISDILLGNRSKEEANILYKNFMKETEEIIAIHYFAGSIFKTSFWNKAYDLSLPPIKSLTQNPKFRVIFNEIISKLNDPIKIFNNDNYGTWGSFSFYQNILNLGLLKKINNLKNKNIKSNSLI